MDTLWQQKLAIAQQQNIPLYDTPLFRLIHVETRNNGKCKGDPCGRPAAADPLAATDRPTTADPLAAMDRPTVADPLAAMDRPTVADPLAPSTPSLHLTLGNTTYKEYVTTREPTFAQNRPREELSNPLAVCSVIETTDNYILLDKRQGVDVYAGRYHVIGGFFERDLDTTATSDTSDTSDTNPDPFAAIHREIREETGIQAADIAEQHCLGVVYDLATPHAELCFLTRLNIPLHEVHQRVPEENEIKQLLSLSITEETLRDFILTNHGNISATGEPNLLMYGALKFGESWFEEIIGRL
jgi:8-oxo-dGTP pyrophosphatase MutT (NUDIX family)